MVTTYEAYTQALGIRTISMFKSCRYYKPIVQAREGTGDHSDSSTSSDGHSEELDVAALTQAGASIKKGSTSTATPNKGCLLAIGSFDNKVV